MILQRRVATPVASAASSSLRIASNARPRRLRSSADVSSAAANATTQAHQYAGYPLTVSGAELRIRDVRDAARAAEKRRGVKHADGDQTERERRHGEIMAAKAQRDEPERDADDRGDGDPDGRGEPERPARVDGEIADRVRADPEEPGLSDRDLVDVAEQHRKTDRGRREDRDVRPRLHEPRVAARDDAECDDEHREHRQHAAVVAQPRRQSRTASRRPNSPCGRSSSMTSSTEYTIGSATS